jgi:hypothetical protein
MNDEARGTAENAVEVVLPRYRVAGVPTFAKTMEIAPVIPAARPLADVSPDGALIAKLWTCSQGGCLRQHRIAVEYLLVLGDLRQRG